MLGIGRQLGCVACDPKLLVEEVGGVGVSRAMRSYIYRANDENEEGKASKEFRLGEEAARDAKMTGNTRPLAVGREEELLVVNGCEE